MSPVKKEKILMLQCQRRVQNWHDQRTWFKNENRQLL